MLSIEPGEGASKKKGRVTGPSPDPLFASRSGSPSPVKDGERGKISDNLTCRPGSS